MGTNGSRAFIHTTKRQSNTHLLALKSIAGQNPIVNLLRGHVFLKNKWWCLQTNKGTVLALFLCCKSLIIIMKKLLSRIIKTILLVYSLYDVIICIQLLNYIYIFIQLLDYIYVYSWNLFGSLLAVNIAFVVVFLLFCSFFLSLAV